MKLTKAEKAQLAATFECSGPELPGHLKAYAYAATEEYVRMILGQRVLTRGQDIREYRLFLMIIHVFGGVLPDERRISALFQTTTTQSRALLRAVMSKYQYELQSIIRTTLVETVRSATPDPGNPDVHNITVESENVIDALNREISGIDGTLPQIQKARRTVATYDVPKSSYEQLKSHLGL